jgi:hypothetical protein
LRRKKRADRTAGPTTNRNAGADGDQQLDSACRRAGVRHQKRNDSDNKADE